MFAMLEKERVTAGKRESVYSRMKREIAAAIGNGILAPGAMVPSENELVGRYGISRSSVRTALNELEDEGLIFKKPGKGTFVRDNTMMVVENSGGGIRSIGVDFSIDPATGENWYASKLLDGIERVCNSNGCRLALMRNFDIRQLKKGFVDGYISTSASSDAEIEQLANLNLIDIHPVLINRLCYLDNVSYFSVNYRKEAEKAVAALTSRGHRDIRMISGSIQSNPNLPRYFGFCDALGIEPDMDFSNHCITPQDQSDEFYAEMITDFLKTHRPTALFLTNGCFALPLKLAAARLGIRPGHDIEVCCFDDIEYLAAVLDYPLSFVKMPLRQMGTDAADYLLMRFNSNHKLPAMKKLYQAAIASIN